MIDVSRDLDANCVHQRYVSEQKPLTTLTTVSCVFELTRAAMVNDLQSYTNGRWAPFSAPRVIYKQFR